MDFESIAVSPRRAPSDPAARDGFKAIFHFGLLS
jgi:hypothetical protein